MDIISNGYKGFRIGQKQRYVANNEISGNSHELKSKE